ncbi:uncharacterized protein LOC109835013 [Asparagus officinalis]|uniref:uncharacterized protein LOC109835013 n=1 Tax=Asparagus officinalis TaxID=4686 RepID=UPI00098DEE60|nr:uncharacterized protein LOC109835013 [Asparagus officinalis]
MNELCRNFLWGNSDLKFKPPLVSWDKVCTGKKNGGLGIFSASLWNTAAALRTIWYIHTNKESLWIKWIHGNYIKNRDIWSVNVKTGDSWVWKQVLKVRNKAMITWGGVDNLKKIISSCYYNSKVHLSDLYSVLSPATAEISWFMTVWEKFRHPKHSFITWLAVQGKLLTQDRLINRGIIQVNKCYLCEGANMESHSHLFFDCRFSNRIWNAIMDWLNFKWRASEWSVLLDWYNSRLKGKSITQRIKRMALSTAVYTIWRERNDRFFKGQSKSSDMLIKSIKVDILTILLNSQIPAEEKVWLSSL